MTLKVGHGQKSVTEVTGNSAPGGSHSHGELGKSETGRVKTYAHDNTPARQRELEIHGHNLRAKVESQSQKHGDKYQSQRSEQSERSQRSQQYEHSQRSQQSQHLREQHSQRSQQSDQSQRSQQSHASKHSDSEKSGRDLDVKVNEKTLGVEIEAKVGSNKSHGNSHSHQSHGDFDSDAAVRGSRAGVQSRTEASFNLQRHSHGHGDAEAKGAHASVQAKTEASLNPQRQSHGPDDADGHRGHSDTQFKTQASFKPDGHSHGHDGADGHGSHSDIHFKNDASPGAERHSHAQSSGHDETGKIKDQHHSADFRTESQTSTEQKWSHHSNNGADGEKRLLRDTVGHLKSELHEFRSDHKGGTAHESIGLTDRQIEKVLQVSARGVVDRFNLGEHPERIARQVIGEGSEIIRLAEHFNQLERIAGEPVRRAYEAVMNFLLNGPKTELNRFGLTSELLRDLRSGAFLNPRDMEGPFPLTGRARIVSEMMAVMRTIDAIEKFSAGMRAYALPGPTLPGLAGRLEIPRLIAALDGFLTDAAGRPLLMADGTPLKLGELLLMNAYADSALESWGVDRLPVRLSPLIVHGFDAVYSLIGFDGRPLSLPRFMAIQSQINASEFEWLFGQAPLSEGWVRSAIEFLKDSISFDHNVLGELLEEALTTGRFHLTVMSGTVEEGKPVSGSFSFTPVESFSPVLSGVGL